MKSTKRHFILETGEYLITGQHPDCKKYKLFYDGKNVTNTTIGVIRIKMEELENET